MEKKRVKRIAYICARTYFKMRKENPRQELGLCNALRKLQFNDEINESERTLFRTKLECKRTTRMGAYYFYNDAERKAALIEIIKENTHDNYLCRIESFLYTAFIIRA